MKKGDTFFPFIAFILGIIIGAVVNCNGTQEEYEVEDRIHELTLSDGTMCVLFWTNSFRQGDIECNWKDNPPPQGEKEE